MNLTRKLYVGDINRVYCACKRVEINKLLCLAICQFQTLANLDLAILDRAEKEWRRRLSNVKDKGNAVFVLGPMGAGKSTRIENYFKNHPKYKSFAYVDTDEIMGHIEEFSADKVDIYYPLARKIAINLTDWILERNISFVAEGTCVKYDELIEYMDRLKETGYQIYVNRLPPISLDEILHRSKYRKNRIIPVDVVSYIYTHSAFGLEKLYEYNKQVDYKLFHDLEIPSQTAWNNFVKPCIVSQ